MLLYHITNPAGAVEILKEVIISHLHLVHSVNVSLPEHRPPSDLGIHGIGKSVKGIINLRQKNELVLGSGFLGGYLDGSW